MKIPRNEDEAVKFASTFVDRADETGLYEYSEFLADLGMDRASVLVASMVESARIVKYKRQRS